MSYDIGDHINLSHLNKRGGKLMAQKKSASCSVQEVGTQIVFKIINQKYKAFRRVPVVFA